MKDRLSPAVVLDEGMRMVGEKLDLPSFPQAVRQKPVLFAGLMAAALWLTRLAGGTPARQRRTDSRAKPPNTTGDSHGYNTRNRHQQEQDAGGGER